MVGFFSPFRKMLFTKANRPAFAPILGSFYFGVALASGECTFLILHDSIVAVNNNTKIVQ